VNDSLAVGEGNGVADLLKDDEQMGEGVFGDRLGLLHEEIVEHLAQRDAAHVFHGVKDALLIIDAQFVDGDDIRVLELAGDLGLGDEAHHVVGRIALEHDFHGDVALDGDLAGVEDRAHAALGDYVADFVFLFAQEFRGQELAQGVTPGAEGKQRGGRSGQPANGQRDAGAEHNWLVRAQDGDGGDALAVDESAVGTAEILDQALGFLDRQARVHPGDQRRFDAHIGLGAATDDVRAGKNRADFTGGVFALDGEMSLGQAHGQGWILRPDRKAHATPAPEGPR